MCSHGKESAPVTCWLTRFEKGGHEPPVPHRIADFRLEDDPYVPWLHMVTLHCEAPASYLRHPLANDA